jgi:hypothetical protein
MTTFVNGHEGKKKWDGKINVSKICSSHTQKTIKSGKRISENNSIKLLEFFITVNFEYELFTFKFHLKKVKFQTSKTSIAFVDFNDFLTLLLQNVRVTY